MLNELHLPLFGWLLVGVGGSAVLWFGLRGLFARASGWESLSSWFRVEELPHGEHFRFASGSMGKAPFPVNYQLSLGVTVTPSGLGLSMLSVFGRSPSLFIPWAQVESLAASKFMFTEGVVIRVRSQWPTISLYGPPAKAALRTYEELLSKRAL